MRRPGVTLKFITITSIVFIAIILALAISFYLDDSVMFYSKLITPFTIMLSANLGVLSAVLAAGSNRRETVRQNTLNMLNKLDSDTQYWTEVDKLIQAINYARKQWLANKQCKHICDAELTQCKCCLEVEQINNCLNDYLNKNPQSRLFTKGMSRQECDISFVIRKMECLCEQASLGLIDEKILGRRKGVVINYVYDACKKIIEDKQNSHIYKYGFIGHKTGRLVYQFISDSDLRSRLLSHAVKESL
jgi:hypothetical protein